MAKAVPSVEEVLKKASGGRKKAKGTPAKKKTPCWLAYKSQNRGYTNKIKKLEKQIAKYPNDKQTASRLQSIKDKRYGV